MWIIPVASEWIWNFVQSKKISFQEVRKDFVRRSKCLTRHLQNLNELEEESIALESTTIVRSGEETAELVYRSSNEGLMAIWLLMAHFDFSFRQESF